MLSEKTINDCKVIPIIYQALKDVFWDKYKYKLLPIYGWAPENDRSHPSYKIVNTIYLCNKRGYDMIHINPYSIGIFWDIMISTKDLNILRKICVANNCHEFHRSWMFT